MDGQGTNVPRVLGNTYAGFTGDTFGRFGQFMSIVSTAYDAGGTRQVRRLDLTAEPRWRTTRIGGDYAYPSTGEVIGRRSRKVVAPLEDERGMFVHSERMLEIHFDGRDPIRVGDQAATGQKIGQSGK